MTPIRTGLTNITSLGANTSYTISNHPGGDCNSAFVMLRRTSAVSPSSITYGGVAMTQLVTQENMNSRVHEIWGLIGCSKGDQDVVITCPSSVNVIAGVVTYASVDRLDVFPVGTNSAKQLGTPLSVSVNAFLDNCVLIGIGGHEGLAADEHSPGTDTSRISLYNNGSGIDVGMLESSSFNTGAAGNKSLQITLGTGGQDMVLGVVALSSEIFKTQPSRGNIMSFDTASPAASHTESIITYGNNRLLLVAVEAFRSGSTASCDSVTYDGNNMTKIGSSVFPISGMELTLWYYVNPSLTAKDVVVNCTNTNAGDGFIRGTIFSYMNIRQTDTLQGTPVDNSGGAGSDMVFSATTDVHHCMFVCVMFGSGASIANGSLWSNTHPRPMVFDYLSASKSATMTVEGNVIGGNAGIAAAFAPANDLSGKVIII